MLRKPAVVISLVFLALVVLATIFANWLAPYGPNEQDLLASLQTPSSKHLLGTGELGLDELSRIIYGGRVTLLVVAVAVVVDLLIGAPLGVLAGYRGGRIDSFVLRLADVAFAVPGTIVILAVVSVFPGNEVAAMAVFGLLGAPGLARVVRSATLGVRGELYVRAAIANGIRDRVIVRRHVLPRVTGVLLVQTSIFAATAVLMETGLGFLGLGTTKASWGLLVSEASQNIGTNPWLLVPSGAIIILFVLALTTLSDGIRDALEQTRASAVVRTRKGRKARPQNPAAQMPAADEVGPDALEPLEGALLSVRGLSVTLPASGHDTTVIKNVDFDLKPGEALGIVGESGCGKSITVSALFGMLPGGGRVSSGTVTFDGMELTGAPAQLREIRRSRVGWISQDPIASLDPSFTAGSQVADVVRMLTGCSRRDAKKRALQLFEQVQLPDPAGVAKRYPHQLSGGMAQRVGIAAALAGNPDLIIADEPTTALDVTVQAEILDILRDLRDKGTAVVLITHNWGVLADLCQRAVVMYAGEVVETATVTEIVRDPAHPYTAALLRSSPSRAVPQQPLPALEGVVPPPKDWPVGCHFQSRCSFVTPDCKTSAIALKQIGDGDRSSRCLRSDEEGLVAGAVRA